MAFRKKADFILKYKPDILVVPECEHPDRLKFKNGTQKPTHVFTSVCSIRQTESSILFIESKFLQTESACFANDFAIFFFGTPLIYIFELNKSLIPLTGSVLEETLEP